MRISTTGPSTVLRFLLATGLLSVLPTARVHATWTVETVFDGHTFDEGRIAIDATGTVHVAYGGDHLYYAQRGATGWSVETVDTAQLSGSPLSLTLDSSGAPEIAYQVSWWAGSLRTQLRYARRVGGTWSTEIADANNAGSSLGAARDVSGFPVIGYMARTVSPTDLSFARWDGSTWLTETVQSSVRVFDVSVAVDASDVPWLTMTEYPQDELRVDYRPGAGPWITDYPDLGSTVTRRPAIAIDAGAPIIAYRDDSAADLRLVRRVGATWQSRVVDSAGDIGDFPALAVTPGGEIHIAYVDNSNLALKHAQWDGTLWTIATITPPGVAVTGALPSIAVDPSGQPWVVYFDGAASRLVVTHWDGASWQEELVDLSQIHGRWPLLAFDALNRPVIAESAGPVDYGTSQWLASHDGNNWSVAPIDLGFDSNATHLAYDTSEQLCLVGENSVRRPIFARHDGAQWISATIDSSGRLKGDARLRFDGGGAAHVAYHDDLNARGVVHATDATGTWATVLVEGQTSINSGRPELRIDAAGRPVMAYADPSGLYDEIHVASWDGASWQVDVAVGPSANDHFNHQVGMVIDRSGLPAVAYRLSSLPYELRVSRHDGTSWVALPPPATDVNFFASTSLELDPMGNLAVVYVQNPLGALVYAVWNGNIWTQEILVADGVESFDYRLDRQGDPAIAIWDYGDGALRLARWTDQIHRGELPTALVPIATTVLPWDDPEPVLDPTAPALYYYQVDGVSEISLIEVGQTIRIQ